MSDISTIFDGVVSRITGLLPNHTRLSNPYAIDENSDHQLKKGFGVALGPGRNTKRIICEKHSVERSIIVTITRQVFAKENDTTKRDDMVKNLLEDHAILIKDAWNIVNYDTGATKFNFEEDSGIEFARFEDGFKFIQIRMTYLVEYIENI